MLPTAQAGSCQARDASGEPDRSLDCLAGNWLLREAEHRFYQAGESDYPTRDSRSGSSHLGDSEASPTLDCSPRVVACLLSFCASSPGTARGTCAAGSREVATCWRNATGRGRKLWQRAKRPDGAQQGKSSVLRFRRSHPELVESPEVRRGSATWQRQLREAASRWGSERQDEAATLDG